MGRIINSGLVWEGTKSRKVAILLVALCIAAMLVATLAPISSPADSVAAGAEGEIIAAGFTYPNTSTGSPWYPASSSYSMRGVSWS